MLIAIAASVVTYFVCSLIPIESSIVRLVVNFGICIVVPNVIFVIAWFKLKEFKGAWGMARRMLGRKRNVD